MDDDFELANRAFELFTREERARALEQFATLKYPSIKDRFFEAVHRVLFNMDSPSRLLAEMRKREPGAEE